MLARAEGEALAQLGRDLETDRIGFAGLGNDLRDAERVEMLGQAKRLIYQVASG